jgi:hypothetical protein
MSDETPTAPAARVQPSASYSFTMRLHAPQQGGAFARVAQTIADADADAMLCAIDLVRSGARPLPLHATRSPLLDDRHTSIFFRLRSTPACNMKTGLLELAPR